MAMAPPISRRCATERSSSAARASCTSSARRKRSTWRWCSPSVRKPGGSCRRRVPSTLLSAPCSAPTRRFSNPAPATRCGSRTCSTKPSSAPTPSSSAANSQADDGRAARACGADRHRRRQVRGPRERSHQGLRVRLGPHARGRRPHGPVPAIRARADPLDLPPSGGRRRRARSRQRDQARWSRRSASSRSSCSISATAVHEAGETLRPHRLAGYLYDLATAFTAFFETCPVLKAPDERDCARRGSRSATLTARVLARGLGLLGIAAPERM